MPALAVSLVRHASVNNTLTQISNFGTRRRSYGHNCVKNSVTKLLFAAGIINVAGYPGSYNTGVRYRDD